MKFATPFQISLMWAHYYSDVNWIKTLTTAIDREGDYEFDDSDEASSKHSRCRCWFSLRCYATHWTRDKISFLTFKIFGQASQQFSGILSNARALRGIGRAKNAKQQGAALALRACDECSQQDGARCMWPLGRVVIPLTLPEGRKRCGLH